MNAPATLPMTDRILAIIAKNDSKRPANANDVLAQVGGRETDFWAAYAQLTHSRAIATAHIQRPAVDSAPWLAIWPTGIQCDAGAWSSDTHSALFSRTRSVPRFPAVPDPTRDPRPDLGRATKPRSATKPAPAKETKMTKKSVSEERRRQTLVMLTGRTRDNAIRIDRVALSLGVTPQGAANIVDALADRGMARFVVGTGRDRHIVAYDSRTDTMSAPPVPEKIEQITAEELPDTDLSGWEPEPDVLPPTSPAADHVGGIEVHEQVASDDGSAASPEVRIGLWDDGSLTFIDGDEVIQFDASVVERLALLLGVPRDGFATQPARAPFPQINA